MNLALALLLSVPAPAQAAPATNLDFRAGTLTGWEGDGLYVTTLGRGPTPSLAVSSSDRDKPGHTGVLHRAITLPPGAGVVRCYAYAVRPKGVEANERLDVGLMAAGRRVIPKEVRQPDSSFKKAAFLLPPGKDGKPREYVWRVHNYGGQAVRIVLADEDTRLGCHLVCTGFEVIPAEEFDGREFGRFMLKLVKDHKLSPVYRYDSSHFLALSNAPEEFTGRRLGNCELIYDLFFEHFRQKGFRVYEPPSKMMVAVFDTHAGFEAYLGERLPGAVTGVYHPPSNRLLVYDFGTNRQFVAEKAQAQALVKRIPSELHRRRFTATVNRLTEEFRKDANIGTVMHEVAHQLSFNCGLLNRDGDVSRWLGEGLACYCESTENGMWQGLGEPNPERVEVLARLFRGQGKYIPLEDLVGSDAWILGRTTAEQVLIGYSQSWALFKWLMEERTEGMRRYLPLVYTRKTTDRRTADFTSAFGADLKRIELRYIEYMKEQVEEYNKSKQKR